MSIEDDYWKHLDDEKEETGEDRAIRRIRIVFLSFFLLVLLSLLKFW